MVPDRLWYRTIHSVLLGAVHPHVPASPAARCRSSVISGGAAGWGDSICLCLTGVLLWHPQKATLDSLRTLLWFVSYWLLAPKFQHSLSAVILVIYLGVYNCGPLQSQCCLRVYSTAAGLNHTAGIYPQHRNDPGAGRFCSGWIKKGKINFPFFSVVYFLYMMWPVKD